jgi:hypothetical protein
VVFIEFICNVSAVIAILLIVDVNKLFDVIILVFKLRVSILVPVIKLVEIMFFVFNIFLVVISVTKILFDVIKQDFAVFVCNEVDVILSVFIFDENKLFDVILLEFKLIELILFPVIILIEIISFVFNKLCVVISFTKILSDVILSDFITLDVNEVDVIKVVSIVDVNKLFDVIILEFKLIELILFPVI